MHVDCLMKCQKKNILSWNAIIGGLVDVGDYFKAFRLFLMMWQEFSDVGSQTFVAMIRASAGLRLSFSGRQLRNLGQNGPFFKLNVENGLILKLLFKIAL